MTASSTSWTACWLRRDRSSCTQSTLAEGCSSSAGIASHSPLVIAISTFRTPTSAITIRARTRTCFTLRPRASGARDFGEAGAGDDEGRAQRGLRRLTVNHCQSGVQLLLKLIEHAVQVFVRTALLVDLADGVHHGGV